MNKKVIIPAVAVAAVLAAGGGWFVLGRSGDPMENARLLTAKGDLRGAQIELRNAVRTNPSNAEAHFQLAQAQLIGGDPVAAEKEGKAARDLHYDPVQIAILLGQSYMAQARWRDILSDVPEAAPTPEQTARLLVIRSLAHVGLNNLEAAKASLSEAERLSPTNADARMTLARVAFQQREFDVADRKADEALAIDAKRADPYFLKAQLQSVRGNNTAALALLDRAVEAAPGTGTYRLERANLLLALGQDAKAQTDVNAILTRDPRNAGANYTGMVLLIRAGKFAEADVMSQKLGTMAQPFPRWLYFNAIIKANLGQAEQAVDLATRYVARVPNDPDGIRMLARTQMAARRPDAAVATLTRAIAGGQSDAETLDLLGRAYSQDGKQAMAVEQFQRASALAPQNPAILTRLASTQMQVGDIQAAQGTLERSLSLSPAQAGVGEALVAAALATGDMDRAQAALDKLRETTGDTEAVGVLSARIKVGRMDFEGARAQLAATAAKFPQSSGAKVELARVLVLQGKRPEGVALLREVLAKDQADPLALQTLVPLLVLDNRGAEAVPLMEAARAAKPDNPTFTILLADVLGRIGDARKAIALLEGQRMAGSLPLDLELALARAQVAAGAPADAKATYARVLAANPARLDIRQAQVALLIQTEDLEAAKASIRDAMKLSPGNIGLMQALVGLEQRTKGIDSALALADQLRKEPANMPAAAVLKGDILVGARRFTDAVAAFSAEQKAAPSSLLVLRSAGAMLSSGAPDQAAQELRTWLAQHPGDADVAQGLASMDIAGRRYEEAEKNLALVLEKRPNDPAALNNTAWLFQRRGDPRARSYAERAFLQAQTPETSDTLGWIFVTQGEAARGLPLLQQAASQRTGDKTVWYHLAVALKDTGKIEDAVKVLTALVNAPGEFEDKAAAQEMLAKLAAPR